MLERFRTVMFFAFFSDIPSVIASSKLVVCAGVDTFLGLRVVVFFFFSVFASRLAALISRSFSLITLRAGALPAGFAGLVFVLFFFGVAFTLFLEEVFFAGS